MTPAFEDSRITDLFIECEKEMREATDEHGRMKSAHEAYSVILEELDEFWDEVRKKESNRDKANMKKELIQLGAMAIRAIYDLKLDYDANKI